MLRRAILARSPARTSGKVLKTNTEHRQYPGTVEAMDFRVISYYTDLEESTYYRDCAARLVSALDRLRLEHCVEAIASQGSYMANCRYKPVFIQTKLCHQRRPVLWVDVDSEIHQDLRDFRELAAEVDIGLVSPNGTLATVKASPIYFNHTLPAMHLLSQWVARIVDHDQYALATFDHEALFEVIQELSPSINFRIFGDTYCARPRSGVVRPVITMGIAQNASKQQTLGKLSAQKSAYRDFKNHSRVPKILGIGFPFDMDASSCGKRKPKHFVWTNDERDQHISAQVHMDSAIPSGTRNCRASGRAKVAWFVESRAIRADIYEFAMQHSTEIERSYDAFFTCDRYLAEYLKNGVLVSSASNLPWVQAIDLKSMRKSNLCSMFCSRKHLTEGHRLRHKLAGILGKKIDLFGGALGSERLGTGKFPDKSGALIEYMFHIVVENASYDNYYTEKLTDCFVTCTVPVYWGSPSVAEHFNADGIVAIDERFDVEQLTAELYHSKWDAVLENYDRACDLLSADDELFLHVAGAF